MAIEFRENLACRDCVNERLTQMFRIAQEAVANAVKHAKASQIVISLDCGPNRPLVLAVRDDGVGRARTARPEGGLGMRIMFYRARGVCSRFGTPREAEPW